MMEWIDWRSLNVPEVEESSFSSKPRSLWLIVVNSSFFFAGNEDFFQPHFSRLEGLRVVVLYKTRTSLFVLQLRVIKKSVITKIEITMSEITKYGNGASQNWLVVILKSIHFFHFETGIIEKINFLTLSSSRFSKREKVCVNRA
jgi:hypothetical protein